MNRIGTVLLIMMAVSYAMGPVYSQQYIAGHSVAREEVLRSIPVEYINKAREELVVAYEHTSHGTHVSRGMFGLPGYKPGDQELFAISLNREEAGKLWFMDDAMADYPPGAVDLSVGETTFAETTRNFLDAEENARVNVVMWAWCDISGHDVSGNYLPGMQAKRLEPEFSVSHGEMSPWAACKRVQTTKRGRCDETTRVLTPA